MDCVEYAMLPRARANVFSLKYARCAQLTESVARENRERGPALATPCGKILCGGGIKARREVVINGKSAARPAMKKS